MIMKDACRYFLLLLISLTSFTTSLVDFREALKDFQVKLKPSRMPFYHIQNELPRTSLLKCQEFDNEGASKFSKLARGPIRSCHMQGVCFNVRGSKKTVYLSKYLRQNSQIPQVNPGEYYFSTFSGMRGNGGVRFDLAPFEEEALARNNLSVAVITDPTLISLRYMGINTMHVLHDDFLPALATILQQPLLKDCPAEDRLILAVDGISVSDPNDQFLHWLGNFWNVDYLQATIRFQEEMSPDDHLDYICFDDVVAGMEGVSTSWYHYGFSVPQGPIEVSPETRSLVSSNIKAAASWIKRGISVDQERKATLTVSVVSRLRSRVILNEQELVAAIEAKYPDSIVNILRAEELELEELIELAAASDVLIGMHGALLALTAFLPSGSKLIEMFPFAVPAENYTPFKTLASLVGVKYVTWVNPRSQPPFNIGHPEASFSSGGLNHLPASYAAGIVATETVPKHVCCYSPFWIYRIFQDTIVDVTAILELIKQ